MGTITVGTFVDDNGDGGFVGNILRAAGSVAVQNITDIAIFGRSVALAPFGFGFFTSTIFLIPFVAAGAGAGFVFSATFISGAAGIAGARAGILIRSVAFFFRAKPGVAPGTFDAGTIGA